MKTGKRKKNDIIKPPPGTLNQKIRSITNSLIVVLNINRKNTMELEPEFTGLG
jgi:hypothetical protein